MVEAAVKATKTIFANLRQRVASHARAAASCLRILYLSAFSASQVTTFSVRSRAFLAIEWRRATRSERIVRLFPMRAALLKGKQAPHTHTLVPTEAHT
eukprot:158358-Pleurochrysis_carterae.AAC.1